MTIVIATVIVTIVILVTMLLTTAAVRILIICKIAISESRFDFWKNPYGPRNSSKQRP